MAHRKTKRNPLFAGCWFEDEIILLCLRWYFRFKLSYRDLVEILSERGLVIAHTTILRWVVCVTPKRVKTVATLPEAGGRRLARGRDLYQGSRPMDVFVPGLHGQGNTVEFYLSRTRGIAAVKRSFVRR